MQPIGPDEADMPDWLQRIRKSRHLVLFIVFLGLLLDNVLLTVVVPIIPDYLISLEEQERNPGVDPGAGGLFPEPGSGGGSFFNYFWNHTDFNLTYFSHLFYNFTSPDNWTDLGQGGFAVVPEQAINENPRVGWLFSSKAIVQLVANPFIGPLTNRYGTNLPMFLGFVFLLLSTIRGLVVLLPLSVSGVGWASSNLYQNACTPPTIGIDPVFALAFPVGILASLNQKLRSGQPFLLGGSVYAFGETYAVLFAARSVQGVGSACTAIAGMSMLAVTYTEDKERSRAMGIALGGIAFGVLIGYPFGGFMYQFVGKMAPFLVIAALVTLEGALLVWVLQPTITPQDYSMFNEKGRVDQKNDENPELTKSSVIGTPLHILLMDPYILIASGAILFPEMAIAMLEPTLPIWLLDTMNPEKWQLGTVFVPDSIGYLIGCNFFGIIALKIGRWICTIASLLLIGVCLLCIPLATHMTHLIVPHFGLGLALGIADVSIMPLLALLVDTRHVAVYGSVYAIAQVSISLGFAVGPSVGGQLVKRIGFPWLIRGMAIANLVYCPLCYFLRDPPTNDENKSILLHDHSQYTQEESFDYRRLDEEPETRR